MPTFRLRQRLIALGDDYDVTDASGAKAFHVDGKLFRIRDTFVIEDPAGREVATIREKLVAIRDTMTISRDGETLATIRKKLIAPFRDAWTIDVEGGEELTAQGDLLDHEYEIRRGRETIASVSKRWFTIRDTYGVDVKDGEDAGLVVAIVVAIDGMAHADEKEE